jgi:DNA end-binding protein Ku
MTRRYQRRRDRFPACSSTERISFGQINRKTGNRLRQQLIDEETRAAVEAGHR